MQLALASASEAEKSAVLAITDEDSRRFADEARRLAGREALSVSLDQKRQAMIVCLDALNALREAILEEPIAGVTYGRPPSPR